MRVSTFLAKLNKARKRCTEEIAANGRGEDKFARGLANEGWAGGYQAALDDVDSMLTHGCPNDPRRYWRDER